MFTVTIYIPKHSTTHTETGVGRKGREEMHNRNKNGDWVPGSVVESVEKREQLIKRWMVTKDLVHKMYPGRWSEGSLTTSGGVVTSCSSITICGALMSC